MDLGIAYRFLRDSLMISYAFVSNGKRGFPSPPQLFYKSNKYIRGGSQIVTQLWHFQASAWYLERKTLKCILWMLTQWNILSACSHVEMLWNILWNILDRARNVITAVISNHPALTSQCNHAAKTSEQDIKYKSILDWPPELFYFIFLFYHLHNQQEI